ncbi:CDAN1-interacting nuclease 1 like protein, partial [Aduncisulcus paluster]
MTFPTPPSNACSFAIDCSGQLGSASFWGGSGCSIGAEYEYILQQQLLQYKTHFITEEMLYVCGGVTGVPDILLDVPIVVKGHLVNWIDSKAIFGSISYHRKQYVRQYSRFTEKNGKGCVVYWYGYEQGCESLFDDVIVLSHLPLSDEGEICVIEERERAVVGKDHRDQAEIMKDLHRSGGTDYEELSGGSDALVENDDTDVDEPEYFDISSSRSSYHKGSIYRSCSSKNSSVMRNKNGGIRSLRSGKSLDEERRKDRERRGGHSYILEKMKQWRWIQCGEKIEGFDDDEEESIIDEFARCDRQALFDGKYTFGGRDNTRKVTYMKSFGTSGIQSSSNSSRELSRSTKLGKRRKLETALDILALLDGELEQNTTREEIDLIVEQMREEMKYRALEEDIL